MPSAIDQSCDRDAALALPPHAINIDVPESFARFAEVAVTRLRYLYPSWVIDVVPGAICVSNVGSADKALIQREVNYALYRERIRTEGEPLRALLLKSVMA